MENKLPSQPTLQDIQRLLSGQGSRRQLRRNVAELCQAGTHFGNFHLTRAKYKPGRPLRAFFDIPYSAGSDSPTRVHPISVVWYLPGQMKPSSPSLESAQADIRRRGIQGPFRRLWLDDSEQEMHLQVWPLDPEFEQLSRMADPGHLRKTFIETGDLRASWQIFPVRYRPGERHILRLRRTPQKSSADLYVKLYHRPEDAARAFRIAHQVGDWLDAHHAGLIGIRPRDWSTDDAVVFYPHAPGVPLSSLLGQPGLDLSDRLRQIGQALLALHTSPGTLAAELEVNDLDQEVRAVNRATQHVQAFLPGVGEQIQRNLEQISTLGTQLPNEVPTFTHSDFKADHLLINPGEIVLIDFDTCSIADPASDVGKFLADLEWWFMLSGKPGLERTQASFLEGYAAIDVPERFTRARLYHALILMKITARRARIYDSNWSNLVTRLVQRAGEILQQPEAHFRGEFQT